MQLTSGHAMLCTLLVVELMVQVKMVVGQLRGSTRFVMGVTVLVKRKQDIQHDPACLCWLT